MTTMRLKLTLVDGTSVIEYFYLKVIKVCIRLS